VKSKSIDHTKMERKNGSGIWQGRSTSVPVVFHDVGSQLNVPTSLSPVSNHLCLYCSLYGHKIHDTPPPCNSTQSNVLVCYLILIVIVCNWLWIYHDFLSPKLKVYSNLRIKLSVSMFEKCFQCYDLRDLETFPNQEMKMVLGRSHSTLVKRNFHTHTHTHVFFCFTLLINSCFTPTLHIIHIYTYLGEL
jgi:hypothetical protein